MDMSKFRRVELLYCVMPCASLIPERAGLCSSKPVLGLLPDPLTLALSLAAYLYCRSPTRVMCAADKGGV